MARLKLKKKGKFLNEENITENERKIPIKDLPEKFIRMKVTSGTKIRNVLGYALKQFPQFDNILWTAAGQGVAKVITCVEIFKKNNPGLHQVTKLQYIDSKKVDPDADNKQQVPEINIFLSKEALDTSEPGYQRSDDLGMFQNLSIENGSANNLKRDQQSKMSRMSSSVAEEFSAMGLRIGQKRPRKDNSGQEKPINKKGKK